MTYVRPEPTKPVIYVLDDGTVVEKLVTRISPDRLKTSCPAGSKYVIRLGPRSKLWEVYRISQYTGGPGFGQFYRAPPPAVMSEHRDAAIGYAQLMPK